MTSLLAAGRVGIGHHPLHDPDRAWSETNCYLDLWIEALHARGLDPVPACAATLSSGWEVDQWTMVKPSETDLRVLYGFEVAELNPWDTVASHVAAHLAAGNLVTVEVDAWWLPDTPTYRTAHEKTSIAPLSVTPGSLVYAHGAGVHEAVGEDAEHLLAPAGLPPYVELVPGGPTPAGSLPDRALERVRAHLAARPSGDPVAAMGAHLAAVLPRLCDETFFHAYAFATWRQLGAAAEVAADLARWLDPVAPGAGAAAEPMLAVAGEVKAFQYALARASRGRTVDLDGPLASLAAAWAEGLARVENACAA